MESKLTFWTIYYSPSDFPGKYVVRKSWVLPGGATEVAERPAIVAGDLADARAVIPLGFHRMDRHPSDDPVILEVWF